MFLTVALVGRAVLRGLSFDFSCRKGRVGLMAMGFLSGGWLMQG